MNTLFERVTKEHNYQTPAVVAEYMASFLPGCAGRILEPTPGEGNLVRPLLRKGEVLAPERFEDVPAGSRFDYIVMNPPFTPMSEGYRYLSETMRMADNIVALLPWFILINSERRLKKIMEFGLKEVISLPRKVFPGTRIQCCILILSKGYSDSTVFKAFNW
jgi:hypothetical protein